MAKDKICTPFLALASPENKFTISTIEDMQSRVYLKIGDVVELNGYYTAGDGAGHKRKIEATDDGSGVQLANGLWGNIVHNGEVNVSWFGAKGDGTFNNNDIFATISLYVSKCNFKSVIINFQQGTYIIGKQVRNPAPASNKRLYQHYNGIYIKGVDKDITLNGNNCTLKFFDGYYFGSFDQITGEPCATISTSQYTRAEIGYCIYIKENGNVQINDFNLHGNARNVNLGGTWGDTGRQLACYGIVAGHNNTTTIKNINIKESATDGCSFSGAVGQKLYVDNLNIEEVSRNGMSLGGGEIIVRNSKIVNCGNTDYFNSAPSSGVDLETEGEKNENLLFDNVAIANCKTAFVSDYADCKYVTFLNCYFSGSVALWLDTPKNMLIFDNCVILGKISHLGVGSEKSFLRNSLMSLNPKYFKYGESESLFTSTSSLFFDNYNGITFENVTMDIDDKLFPNSPETVYKDCTFIGSGRTSMGTLRGYATGTINYNIEPDAKWEDDLNKRRGCVEYRNGVMELNKSDYNVNGLEGEDLFITAKNRKPVTDRLRLNSIIFDSKAGGLSGWYVSSYGTTTTDIQCDIEIKKGSRLIYLKPVSGSWYLNQRAINIEGVGDIFLYENTKTNIFVTDRTFGDNESTEGVVTVNVKRYGNYVYSNFSITQTLANSLNTPYHILKMQQEGVYEDFIAYMDEKTEYDRLQRESEQQRQSVFEQSGMENYEEWLAEQPMLLPVENEPQPSEKLLSFKEKYLG